MGNKTIFSCLQWTNVKSIALVAVDDPMHYLTWHSGLVRRCIGSSIAVRVERFDYCLLRHEKVLYYLMAVIFCRDVTLLNIFNMITRYISHSNGAGRYYNIYENPTQLKSYLLEASFFYRIWFCLPFLIRVLSQKQRLCSSIYNVEHIL